MRWALISDIHGNREALDAVFYSIDSKKADSIICLGDIVGYGADPNYCVEEVQKRVEIIIIGNHDHAAIGLTSTDYFNAYARKAAIWTSHQLTRENRIYLQELDYTHKLNDILLVHSTPHQPERWGYIFSSWEAEWQFSRFTEKLCFIGHSHVPAVFKESGGGRLIINIGSVGQPRDNDPRSCYYIYDDERDQGDWVRVEYPIDVAANKIREAGLPEMLAERLYYGR